MTPKWNFWRGGGVQFKKPSVGGIWIFSGTTQFKICWSVSILALQSSNASESQTVIASQQNILIWTDLYINRCT